jgi:hypothetical protein
MTMPGTALLTIHAVSAMKICLVINYYVSDSVNDKWFCRFRTQCDYRWVNRPSALVSQKLPCLAHSIYFTLRRRQVSCCSSQYVLIRMQFLAKGTYCTTIFPPSTTTVMGMGSNKPETRSQTYADLVDTTTPWWKKRSAFNVTIIASSTNRHSYILKGFSR